LLLLLLLSALLGLLLPTLLGPLLLLPLLNLHAQERSKVHGWPAEGVILVILVFIVIKVTIRLIFIVICAASCQVEKDACCKGG
jgi:hypothetical protein